MDHATPCMNWLAPNQADAFKIFKQRIELYFTTKKIRTEEQPAHILLQVGEEGLQRYNAMTLLEDEKKQPSVIFKKFEEQLEPAEHFHVGRLRLMHMRQLPTESTDDFINRARLQVQVTSPKRKYKNG